MLVGQRDDLRSLIVNHAECVGVLDVDGCDIVGQRVAQRVKVQQSCRRVEGNLVNLNVMAEVVGEHQAPIEQQRCRDEDAFATREHHAAA